MTPALRDPVLDHAGDWAANDLRACRPVQSADADRDLEDLIEQRPQAPGSGHSARKPSSISKS
jgi:hypothetical protein